MKPYDINYIRRYVEEIMALYDADEEGFIPYQVADMSMNVFQILEEEQKERNENTSVGP